MDKKSFVQISQAELSDNSCGVIAIHNVIGGVYYQDKIVMYSTKEEEQPERYLCYCK